MSFFFRGLGVAAFLYAVASPAAAQALSLTEAQRLAVARSQQIAAQDAALRGAAEMAVAAGQRPDPVLKLGVDNLPINGPDRLSLSRDFMTMRRIGVMQELPRAEKRRLKVERVEQDAQRILAERELAGAVVRKETAVAWLDRYYAQATLDLLHDLADEVRLQIKGAEIAYRSGRGSQVDVFSAHAALATLDDRLQQAERQVRNARLTLARWIGGEANRPLAAIQTDADLPSAESHRPAEHPQLAVLAAQVKAAETEVRQAEANARPDWTVEAAYQQRGSAYSNMVSIGLSIPLQLDRAHRQDRETAAKRFAVEEARAKLADALAAHEAEIAVAASDWESARRRAARLTSALLPPAKQRTQAALTTYRAGKGDLASVLSARRDEIDARLQVLTVETEAARAGAQLAYLTTQTPITARSEQP